MSLPSHHLNPPVPVWLWWVCFCPLEFSTEGLRMGSLMRVPPCTAPWSSPLHEDSWVPRRDLQKSLPGLASRAHHSATAPGRTAPTESQPQFTAASFAFLPGEDTPAPQAFLLWRKQPYEGASPRDTEVCTVPSLPAIWGHGGGGNKVTFQRFLVQQRKANAAISWA